MHVGFGSPVGLSLIHILELITGRTHQIRAHLKKAGFPVIGDGKYGDPAVNRKVKKTFQLTTQLLHAYKIRFERTDPALDYLEGREITAKLPGFFEGIKKELLDVYKRQEYGKDSLYSG